MAHKSLQQSKQAADAKFWTMNAYIQNIQQYIDNEVKQGFTCWYWHAAAVCGDALPDKERMEKIIKHFQSKGYKAEIIRFDVLRFGWGDAK